MAGIEQLRVRLMAHVLKDNSGCWLWTGDRNTRDGYGRIGAGGFGSQKLLLAHRASFECHVGPIPEGRFVLHRCDIPQCVNPEHLFLGTLRDNVQDCMAKGRHVALRGEKNPMAKLTNAAIREIRSIHFCHGTITQLARKFGVSRRAISFARQGDSWNG